MTEVGKQFSNRVCQQLCKQAHAAGHQELKLSMQLSATFLTTKGADFHKSQGYIRNKALAFCFQSF